MDIGVMEMGGRWKWGAPPRHRAAARSIALHLLLGGLWGLPQGAGVAAG